MAFLKNHSFLKKQVLWTLILCSCYSNSGKDNHTKINVSTASSKTSTLSDRDKSFEKSINLFNNKVPFKILTLTNSLNKSTTDTDTSKCSSWTLTKENIKKIIKNSEPIDGTTWDLSF